MIGYTAEELRAASELSIGTYGRTPDGFTGQIVGRHSLYTVLVSANGRPPVLVSALGLVQIDPNKEDAATPQRERPFPSDASHMKCPHGTEPSVDAPCPAQGAGASARASGEAPGKQFSMF